MAQRLVARAAIARRLLPKYLATGASSRARPQLRHVRHFADVPTDFDRQLMPEDVLHLRATSMGIMQDPVCELRPEEARRYVVERPDPQGADEYGAASRCWQDIIPASTGTIACTFQGGFSAQSMTVGLPGSLVHKPPPGRLVNSR